MRHRFAVDGELVGDHPAVAAPPQCLGAHERRRRCAAEGAEPLVVAGELLAYADNPNWSKCYCCERIVEDYEARTKDQNRALRSSIIRSGRANGLVAYRLGRVVGWCHAAPKNELVEVPGEHAPSVGAIVCFVVAPDQRRQGIATLLLEAAVEHLRSRGLTAVEAYPWLGEVDPARWVWAQYV